MNIIDERVIKNELKNELIDKGISGWMNKGLNKVVIE